MADEKGARIRRIQEVALVGDVAKALGMAVVKRGASVLTICPFHSDTSPSLTLYDNEQANRHFHCYACGAHGDVFALVQQVRGVDFMAAAEWLAGQYGLPSPGSGQNLELEKGTVSARLHGLELALQIFKARSDEKLLSEFLELRQIPERIAKHAELLAVPGGSLLHEVQNLKEKGENWRELQGYLEEAGLLRSYATSWSRLENFKLDVNSGVRDFYYDDRIIFPVRNLNGGLVGFAGRKIDWTTTRQSDEAPKYLYSPKLPKAETIYRVEANKSTSGSAALGDAVSELFVVEGLMDAVRMESLRIPAVSILGALASADQEISISRLADASVGGIEVVSIFLDRDVAGIRGTAKLTTGIYLHGLVPSVIWPTKQQLDALGVDTNCKDPDEILKGMDALTALVSIPKWKHPALLGLLAHELNTSPEQILDAEAWSQISRSRKARALSEISVLIKNPLDLLAPPSTQYASENEWFEFANKFYKEPSGRNPETASASFVIEEVARLNLARSLACSGVQRGDMAPDLSTWTRIDVLATAFNESFRSRLQQQDLRPIEPFDAMYVSRGIGKHDHRLKVMPCPEDLIVQQYLLNEVLTELNDKIGSRESFSIKVPAVRYYRDGGRTITTGTDTGQAENETLSFAYQLDMEVLEGRQPPTGNGIFRPYFQCWKDFVAHLRRSGERMSKVHVLRLDVRRYYDELSRGVVRDLLRRHLGDAARQLAAENTWAPLLVQPDAHMKSEVLVDWLCDQSFGFSYFDPEAGSRKTTAPDRGIPQGPVLSAWLGTIALFPLDDLMRKVMRGINNSESTRVGYGRYVDDIVLIAESAELLSLMKARAEDAVRRLSLTLIQKADAVPPMSAQDFSQFLTEGRAFATSEPDAEPMIFDAGDGEAGWQMWGWETEDVERNTALHLLHDKRLYDVNREQAIDHLFTALRADDLRPKDLAKAARWLWLHSALVCVNEGGAANLWPLYRSGWETITRGSVWSTVNAACPWEDPAFYAMEGLEKLLDIPQGRDPIRDGRPDLISALRCVATATLASDFIGSFVSSDDTNNSNAWGFGTRKLGRMFWNHALPLRAKAVNLLKSNQETVVAEALDSNQERQVGAFGESLTRARITHFEATGQQPSMLARAGGTDNRIHDGIIWLHTAFVRFANATTQRDAPDPLDYLQYEQWSLRDADPIHRVPQDRFMPLLRSLQPDVDEEPEREVAWLAMATLSALADWNSFGRLMARRVALAKISLGATPLPILPGIVPKDLLLIKVDANERASDFVPANAIKVLAAGAQPTRYPLPFFEIDGSGPKVEFITLNWKSDGITSELGDQLRLFDADLDVKQVNVYLNAPACEMKDRTLSFAADLFEALARLNFDADVDVATRTEYVPAWPYFAFVGKLTDSMPRNPTQFGLLCLPVRSSEVGNQAFIRSGSRGLRPVAVPSDGAHLWRAGVAVSDLVGLSEDVDKYRVSLESAAGEDRLGHEVLLESMRRLRGCFAKPSTTYRQDREKKYLPASLSRVLRGMREFPVENTDGSQHSFAISLKHETNAMAVRLSTDGEMIESGTSAHFLEQTARVTTRYLPRTYLESSDQGSYIGSGVRQSVLGYRLLIERLRMLQPPKLAHMVVAWQSLLAGLELASVTTWLRSLAFELLADERRRATWSLDLASDVSAAWNISDPKLVLESLDIDQASLSVSFRNITALSGHRAHLFLEAITPLGWLALVADQIGLFAFEQTRPFSFRGADGAERFIDMEDRVSALAARLSSDTQLDGVHRGDTENWPFDLVESMIGRWADVDSSTTSQVLGLIDQYCGYSIQTISDERWTYDPGAKTLLDGTGQIVPLLSWQINSLGEGGVWSQIKNNRYVSQWSETRDSEGRLLGVSVWRRSFGELVSVGVGYRILRNDGIPLAAGFEPDRGKTKEPPSEQFVSDSGESIQSPPDRDGGLHQRREAAPESGPTARAEARKEDRSSSPKNLLRDLQAKSWRSREKSKSDLVRVAILQWQVDDTYRHPIFDLSLDENVEISLFGRGEALRRKKVRAEFDKIIRTVKDTSNLEWGSSEAEETTALLFAQSCASTALTSVPWTETRALPSWSEHRRREIIAEALDACNKFKVDALVLPEYSVRPDTVAWIARLLRSNNYKVSVYAGTYRLFGGPRSIGFEQTLGEAFGLGEHLDMFGSTASSSNLELSSVLSLVAPLQTRVEGLPSSSVSVFTRRKKYPSAAADEVFRPGTTLWSPLYTLRDAIEDLRYRGADGLRSKGAPREITAHEALSIAAMHMPSQHIAELICSEIFLATSPANIGTLVDQSQQLSVRFSTGLDYDSILENLKQDILAVGNAFGRRTSPEGTALNLVRRTILVVPAMTSRSADYWIFGQAGLLAAGLTTVFCNASCKSVSVGGSCIVGYNSWKDSTAQAGLHAHVTPYSGWSRGIYYNKRSDALGEEEQALVIVDIDPIYMNEGKPRPQSLLKPLQLVAHLPIVETLDAREEESRGPVKLGTSVQLTDKYPLFKKESFEPVVSEILHFESLLKSSSIWDPTTKNGSGETLVATARMLSNFTADGKALDARLTHWAHYWRDLPWAREAPAVVDFLWVDHPVGNDSLPLLLVPSWSSD